MTHPSAAPKFTKHSGRVFAFTLMAGFAFVALVGTWKDIPTVARAGQILGVASFLAGVLIPGKLEPVRRGWMAFGEAIGRVTTPVMMAVVYFLVITPIGLLRRALVRRAQPPASFWRQRDPLPPKARMERQF